MQTLACKLALKKSVLKYLALYKKIPEITVAIAYLSGHLFNSDPFNLDSLAVGNRLGLAHLQDTNNDYNIVISFTEKL